VQKQSPNDALLARTVRIRPQQRTEPPHRSGDAMHRQLSRPGYEVTGTKMSLPTGREVGARRSPANRPAPEPAADPIDVVHGRTDRQTLAAL
jgi:hypothetical protein